MPAHFVLLHSPLIGPLTWQMVSAELRRRGQGADAPAWRRLSEVAQGFYPALTDAMATALADLPGPLILAAHSGAGALVPSLAARLKGRVAGALFVDAILPHPGRSWFSTAPPDMAAQLRGGAVMGELPPWDQWWPPGALDRLVPDRTVRETLISELEPLPLGYFEEPAPPQTLDLPAAYLQLSSAYDAESQAAARYGWPLVRLPLHHLAMLTHPEAIAAALQSLSERLAEPAHG